MENERRKKGSGSVAAAQRKLKTAGKAYKTRKMNEIPAKEKPNLEVSSVISILFE